MNTADLLESLEESIAAPGGPQVASYQEALQRGEVEIRRLFHEGTPVGQLVADRADLVDALLTRAWRDHLGQGAPAALVAVGGYGRGELHPASDVDVMILVNEPEDDATNTAVGTFIAFLWDLGLEIGHSVRTLDACVEESAKDVTVATNLMEARFLCGESELYSRMQTATAPASVWPSDAFFRAKRAETDARHQRYDDTGYKLEPNIKNAPGGLRDIQVIGWVAKRHFGCEKLDELVAHGFLSEAELDALVKGQDLLWKIRFALHDITGRREDRLLFDHQRALAEQFGYSDDDASLAVEKFMQDYYRTVMELQRLNEMLMQHFRESILQGGNLAHPVSINRRFQACDGYLEIVSDDVFQRRPLALLEVFLIMQQHPELQGVRASTIRAIRAHRHLIDRRFRASLTARSLFMEILREPEGLTRELRRMNRYGILACYLPAFANIVGRMQYDLFHIYTVDEHTLVLIRNLRRLTAEIHKSEFPLLSKIMTRLPKPELIYIAGLFHDIAKGRGGDHSTLGAEDARVFCQDHGLSDYDTNLVTWLVEDHLLMSMTAQRKDIDDPEVVQVFAQQVGDANRLNYLYLLTVADIRATNPERWNSWVNGLLRGLFLNTRKAIARGLDNPQAQDELIQEKQTEARRLMANSGIEAKAITALWMNLSLDYFLLATPEEVAWQTVTVLSTPPEERPVVIVRPNQARGGTEIFMCASDSANLFAISAQLLDQLRLNIVEARIQTASPGCAMNTFLVLEDNGDLIDEGARTQEVIEVLSASLEENAPIPAGVSRRAHRQLKHFEIPAEVTFTQDPGNQRTTLHLVAADRPGLLSLIGYAFAECGIRVISARITTIGAKVEDFFILTDRTNQPLTDPDIQGCVERGILQRLQDADASET